ncbi:MAG: sugar ABC transporter permease [Candidatus Microthrix subdominans]|nr:sugar ABC transporter permease [Candidatus Microthrix sp.]
MSSTETAHEGRSARANAERRLGWMLCAPAVTVMLVVTAYPIAYAVWLSLQRYDLRFPDDREFIGLANYASVLSASQWWDSVLSTVIITVFSVIIELVLGFTLAWVMHRAIFGRGLVRASTLIPYGIITVVAALAWKFAFDPTTGFVNGLLGTDTAWFGARWSSFFVIILTEIWKTTPFMALLLLAGLTLVPNDLLQAARVDGASAFQRFTRVTLPLMKPAILVALLFRTLDAFRVFDSVYVQTRGAEGTETVSITGYKTLITRLNLGLGSAVSVLVFIAVLFIAALFVKGFGANLDQQQGDL